jgi:uncharacterized RDD family membrane protein YckC
LKCPSCGFDSFLESERCKRCGHLFGIDDAGDGWSPLVESAAVEDAPEAEIITSQPFEIPEPAPKAPPRPKRMRLKPNRVEPQPPPVASAEPPEAEPLSVDAHLEPAGPAGLTSVELPPLEQHKEMSAAAGPLDVSFAPMETGPQPVVPVKPPEVPPLPVASGQAADGRVEPPTAEPSRMEGEQEPAFPAKPVGVPPFPIEPKRERPDPPKRARIELPPPPAEAEIKSPEEIAVTTALQAVNAGLMLPDAMPAASGQPPEWKAELDQRVQNFRRRRARARGATDSNPNLEFDFEEAPEEEPVPPPPLPNQPPIVTTGIDVDLGHATPAAPADEHWGAAETVSAIPSEPIFEREDHFLPHESQPVEFVLDDAPAPSAPEPEPATRVILLAPMTRRLAGGLIDLATLIFSLGVFALIFWRAGGHISTHPLTVLALGFVVVFLAMVYFGAFTAIISTTPGLLWMGIEVRSMWGGPPTLRQALWRAAGCIVSASALLLGYLWALFDDQSLTWHDRMSETYLTPSDADHPDA